MKYSYRMPKKATHHEVHAHLSHEQVKRLHKGETVQLKHDQVGRGEHKLMLSKSKATKMMTAHRSGKGMRLHMSPAEISASGLSLKDVGNALKKGYQLYQKNVKPLVGQQIRAGLTNAIKVGAPALAAAVGMPEASPALAALADKYAASAVNAVGDVTGAFGLPHGKHKKKMLRIKDDYNTLLQHQHPAMNPHLPLPDQSHPQYTNIGAGVVHHHHFHHHTKGGSFLPAGY